MRKGLALICSTLLVALWPLAVCAASPEVLLDSAERNFGEVFTGEELSHVFTVRNVGDAALELADAQVPAPVKVAWRRAAPS